MENIIENNNVKWKQLYSASDNYDAHYITNLINYIEVPVKREYTRCSDNIWVPEIDYFKVLNFTTVELLRTNPNEEVNWIDYYGNSRSYDDFPIMAVVNNGGIDEICISNIMLTEIIYEDSQFYLLDGKLNNLLDSNDYKILRYQGLGGLLENYQKKFIKQLNDANDIICYDIDYDGYINKDKILLKK